MTELVFMPPPAPEFDPMIHARFRNMMLNQLSKEELLEALVQALKELKRLSDDKSPFR